MHGAGPWPQAPVAVSVSICCQKVPCGTHCGRGAGAETTPSLGRGLSAQGGSYPPGNVPVEVGELDHPQRLARPEHRNSGQHLQESRGVSPTAPQSMGRHVG